MIQKFNFGILFSLIGLFIYSSFRFFIHHIFYPHGLLLFFVLLSITMYFSIYQLRKITWRYYVVISMFALLNSILLLASYYYPDLLKNTWNYSIMFTLFVVFTALLFRIQQLKGKLAIVTFWVTAAVGLLVETTLVFKISLPIVYSILTSSFLVCSGLILSLFASQVRRGN
jgi:hypothetical protein